VLEQAKFDLLRCATAESVLRLNKTELEREAVGILRIYTEDQHHECLEDFLYERLSQADRKHFTQVRLERTLFLHNTEIYQLYYSVK